METKVLIQTFTEFAKQKNVDRPTMIRILQDVFRAMIKKRFEHDENFDIVINADKGDLEIWYQKNRSFFLDIGLIFITIWVVFSSSSNISDKIFKDLPKRNL